MLNPTLLRRFFRRSARPFSDRSTPPRSPSRISAAITSVVESLEGRTLHAADPGGTFDTAYQVGDLEGFRNYLETVGTNDFSDIYKFSMPRAGQFHGNLRSHNGKMDFSLLREIINPDGSKLIALVESKTALRDNTANDYLTGELTGRVLQPGNYFLAVHQVDPYDMAYEVRFHADYAGSGMQTARDIGVMQDETYHDYIGNLPLPSPTLNDRDDYYKFRLDSPGAVTVNLNLVDARSSSPTGTFEFIYDANNSGTLEPGELLFKPFAGTNPTLYVVPKPAGTYYIRVIPENGAANYRLSLTADYAGPNGSTARDMGSIDLGKSFNDYLNAGSDNVDFYKLNVNTKRTLSLMARQDDTGTQKIQLYKDVNGNLQIEPSELVTETPVASYNRMLRTVDPGQYLVLVQGMTGAGKYTLHAEMRPDQAGNTLATAKNLGTVNGLARVGDYISAADSVDFYKLTASAAGTISAQLNPELGNADLALIRDANNNGRIDAGEILAASNLTGTQADKLGKSITAGNYFLRVTHGGGSDAKYQLSFHTDYAGSTTATARGVGTLSGVRTFDDWLSGNFGGPISDTQDLYKFNLSATRIFTAKLVGSLKGQDLALQVYRDKNGNGVLESTELVAASDRANSPDEQLAKSLTAGTYFVRVVGLNGETNYRLSMQA